MRYPRKLRKGIRTLNGKPKTKWQRRGQIVVTRVFRALGGAVAVAARFSWLPRIGPSNFKPGGIVTPSARRQALGPEEVIVSRTDFQMIRKLMQMDFQNSPFTVVNIDTEKINKAFDQHIKP